MNKSGFIVYAIIVLLAVVFLLTATGLMTYLRFSDSGVAIDNVSIANQTQNNSNSIQFIQNTSNNVSDSIIVENSTQVYKTDGTGISIKELP